MAVELAGNQPEPKAVLVARMLRTQLELLVAVGAPQLAALGLRQPVMAELAELVEEELAVVVG